MASKLKDNIFNSVQSQPLDRNTFDLSHDNKTTFNMGELVPVMCMEALPGDQFNIDHVSLLRFAPLIAPVMHRVKATTDFFFVPNRLLFDGWEQFITGVGTPIGAPTVLIDDVIEVGSLADYLGIPPGDYSDAPITISPFQAAAYYKIWNDWYRYESVIDEKGVDLVSGANPDWFGFLNSPCLKRAWEHDYFTSALPTTQQGDAVELPLVNQANVPVDYAATGDPWIVRDAAGAPMVTTATLRHVTSALNDGAVNNTLDPNGTLTVDIQAEAASINDLREAFSLQGFLERTMRGGARYIEQIWSHFNVKSSDARLQRPEFLGRSVQNVTISEVLATAQSNNDAATAEVPVGYMAGHGISAGGGDHITYTCEEHGFIFALMSVMPETTYQDGIARQFTRFDRFDYAWPSFANLGERPIFQKEIICHDVMTVTHDDIFGYLPQYSEYRYFPSRVSGEFRDSLAFWTMGRIMDPDNPPALNEEFIQCTPRTDCFAVEEGVDHVLGQIMFKVLVSRKLPRYGVPSVL